MALPPDTRTLVWTVPIRRGPWCLAALVVVNLFFNDTGGKVHRYIGYAAAAVVALRLIYGLVHRRGPSGLRPPSPSACRAHLRAMCSGEVARAAGHNPLGAAMTFALWSLVLLLALSGWVSRWDLFWGDDWPIVIHEILTIVLQVCIVTHLLGVIASSLLERQNLVRAMVDGRKQVDEVPGRDGRASAAEVTHR